jgi:hypothetical protein
MRSQVCSFGLADMIAVPLSHVMHSVVIVGVPGVVPFDLGHSDRGFRPRTTAQRTAWLPGAHLRNGA